MKKKLNNYVNELLVTKNNIYYLFKKKNLKKNYLLNKKKNLNLIKLIQILLLFNIYTQNYYVDFSFFRYNSIKNIWLLLLTIYDFIYKKLKIKIKFFFKIFYSKLSIKNLFMKKNLVIKKSLSIFIKLKLNEILKKKIHSFRILQLRKKKLRIKIFMYKRFKYKILKKIKIKITLFFFNHYKASSFLDLVKYFIEIFNYNIDEAFILYWKRYYIYSLKHLFANIENILKKYLHFLLKQYKAFYSILSLKKLEKNKKLFFFLFFFNENKYKYVRRYKIYLYFNYVNKLLKKNFLKKIDFYLFFFKRKFKKKKFLFLQKLHIKLKKLNKFFFFKLLITLKNFIFLIFLQLLIIWFNCYVWIDNNTFKNNNNIAYYLLSSSTYIGLEILANIKWNCLSFLKFNYFFYNNIIKKSDEIGKKKIFE